MNYNFFNYLTVAFHTHGHRGYERYFENEYARIASRSAANHGATIINVHIVKALPREEAGDCRRTVRVKKLFNFQYLVRNIHGPVVDIYFRRHWLDSLYMNAIAVFLQAQVLEPVMYLKLLEKNVLFMHAAGVSRNGRGYLFPAHGGTGKTTFSMALLNQGFLLLGDDLLFVALDEKTVYPYPRPMHIFTYNVNNLAGARIPWHYRLRIYLKNLLRFVLERLLNTEFLISTRIHADKVFPGNPFGSAVPYTRLFFLRKTGEPSETVTIDAGNLGDLVEEILLSADLNQSLYQVLDDADQVDTVKAMERSVIGKLVAQMGSLTYVNPRRLELNDLGDFIDRLLD